MAELQFTYRRNKTKQKRFSQKEKMDSEQKKKKVLVCEAFRGEKSERGGMLRSNKNKGQSVKGHIE